MKRRNFVKTSAVAVGLVGSSLEISPVLAATGTASQESGSLLADNRQPEYLNRVQKPSLEQSPFSGKQYPIQPMSFEERVSRKIVPKYGFCSLTPGKLVSEALTSGNGVMKIELMGDPFSEQVLFHHERLLMPWKKPVEAPFVAGIFPQVRQLILDGKNKEAVAMAIKAMNESQVKQDTEPHLTIPAFLMSIDLKETLPASKYLRTVDFESGEIKVLWTDEHGEWLRKSFTSRPDNVVVQSLVAPEGSKISLRVSHQKSAGWTMTSGMDWGALKGIGTTDPDMTAFAQLSAIQEKHAPKGVESCKVRQEASGSQLVYMCHLDDSIDNSGYAGITRVISKDGSVRKENNNLIIENATSVLFITRIEHFTDLSEDNAKDLQHEVEKITPDYDALLESHQMVQSEIFNRVKIDLGGEMQYGMSVEELLSDQHSRPDYSPALVEKVFEMGRYWFIHNSGRYPASAPGINSTVNLLMAGAVQGNMKEGVDAYFKWVEDITPDCRRNAGNIFGFRGASYPLFPDKETGASFYYTDSSEIGIWPYWISASGWFIRPYWDHYLVTGDIDFLRDKVIPVFKELAQFYEDFLTITDTDGNYIFVPSISPENVPRNTDASGPLLVNATSDISVCREVLTTLINASETLGVDAENVAKWGTMLSKMPPYRVEMDGTLKEWAWPTMQERYSHRHISHLYGVWPGDEIDPDLTPGLAHAAEIANRRRTFDTMSTAVAGETLPAYSRCHRALVGARLKDNIIVDVQLRQLLEQGYISTSLRCSREPYGIPVPDAHGGIQAIIYEMLLYSKPGIIEILPALPDSLVRGSISGMLARSFARIDNLTWDMTQRTIDLTVTSLKEQDITLVARYGIEDISCLPDVTGNFSRGKADCEVHLPANEQVKIHLELSNYKTLDWLALVE